MEIGKRNPIDTPMETNYKLGNSSIEKIKDVGRYKHLVGKLLSRTHKARHSI